MLKTASGRRALNRRNWVHVLRISPHRLATRGHRAHVFQSAQLYVLDGEIFRRDQPMLDTAFRPHEINLVPARPQLPRHRQCRNHVPACPSTRHTKSRHHLSLVGQAIVFRALSA